MPFVSSLQRAKGFVRGLISLRTFHKSSILARFAGDDVGARARRSTVWSVIDFGGNQGLRLLSNLLLTRLLFPEAFGLMALVSVVMTGLALFSDTGIRSLIVQHEQGDDPGFLDTAWTIQAIRGLILSLVVLAVASPVARLYNEPQLAELLPVAGLAMVLQGLTPTSIYTVNRHLAIGLYIRVKLGVQALGLLIIAALAWKLQSVWALVFGNVISTFLSTAAYYLFLPGHRNWFRIEANAARQMFHFGKWIFLSTVAAFLINQGDRAILGLFVSLEELGVYNVGYFLASVPVLLNFALQQTVMSPLYRIKPPLDSAENRASLFRARRWVALSMVAVTTFLALVGPLAVKLLYDSRYTEAGAMITLFSISSVPLVCLSTIGTALIGVKDSRSMFLVVGSTAVFQTLFLFLLVKNFGIPGALISPGLSLLASYPLRLKFSKKYKVFDPWQDLGITALGLFLAAFACVLHWPEIYKLFV